VICVYSVGQRGAFVQRCQLAMAARPSLYDRTGNRDVGDFIFVRCGGLAGDAGDLLVGDAPFGPELLRALEVGVADLRGALRRVDVDEDADGLLEGAGDGHLVRADHRDLGPPKRAGCRGRKDRGEIRGGGKDGAGDVLGVQVVQPDQDLDQLLGRLEDVFGRVGSRGGCTTNTATDDRLLTGYCHERSYSAIGTWGSRRHCHRSHSCSSNDTSVMTDSRPGRCYRLVYAGAIPWCRPEPASAPALRPSLPAPPSPARPRLPALPVP